MIKLVAFFKRRRGIDVETFQQHWRTTHASLVVRLPGLRRYVQNHTLPGGYHRREPVHDGVAEAWFDDTDALRQLVSTPENAAVRADEANFIDPASLESIVSDEIVMLPGPVHPPDAAKFIAFLKARPDMSIELFQKHWSEQHGPIAAAIPGNRRYVQCHTQRAAYESDEQPVYDGVAMSWFDDLDALRTSGKSAEYRATRDDEANFLAGDPSFVIAREHEIELPA